MCKERREKKSVASEENGAQVTMTNQLSYYVVTRVLCCHLCDMLCRFTEVPKKRSAPKHFLSNPRTYCHQGQKSNSTASYNQNVSRVSMSLALGTKALSQSPFSRNKGNMLLNSLQASEFFEYIYYSGTLIIKDVRCCTRYWRSAVHVTVACTIMGVPRKWFWGGLGTANFQFCSFAGTKVFLKGCMSYCADILGRA